MKIQVVRNKSGDNLLTFTITVSDPHHSCFGYIEKEIMELLDKCKDDVYRITSEESKTKNDVITLIHAVKDKTFARVLENLRFAIDNEFRPKFKSICQEIYNWIWEYQSDALQLWKSEIEPERTRYYFDNDPEMIKQLSSQESDKEIDIEEEDDDAW